jgi:hypothetical protein
MEVAGRAVYAVDDEAFSPPGPEVFQDLAEDRPAPLGHGLLLLVPAGHEKLLPSREPGDLFPLGKKRHSLALLRGRDPEISEVATAG